MEIKLRARLAAYSKIDSIESLTQRVPNSAIDSLFDGTNAYDIVTKEDIDTMFSPDSSNPEDDTKVSYAQIDSLFS